MRSSYHEAFDITFYSEGQEIPVCRLTNLQGNQATLNITSAWEQFPQTFSVRVTIPSVKAKRFPWDENIYGHIVQMPGGVEHFCHPRLRSKSAERLASDPPKDQNFKVIRHIIEEAKFEDWTWSSWYDRLNEALIGVFMGYTGGTNRRRLTEAILQRDIQWALRRLISGGPGSSTSRSSWSPTSREPGLSGLPITDEAMVLRHMFEFELGYPDSPDNWAYEKIKLKFIQFVDDRTDVLCTGKNDTGRFVMRARQDAPISHITGKPMSEFMMAINPLYFLSNPTRAAREGRGIIHCHDFVEPIPAPIKMKGVKTPTPLAKKLTTVTMAICDIKDFNLFVAGEEDVAEFDGRVELGEETTLDAILVTPSGREKLLSYQPKSALMSANEFLPRLEELKELPGFEYQEVPELLETLSDGTPVHDTRYRYWYSDPTRFRHDKVKLGMGGIKGVGRPIPQIFCKIGDKIVEVDIIVSEAAVLGKGARDAAIYPLLALAGVEEVDPTWTWEKLENLIIGGLENRGLPGDGKSEIFVKTRDGDKEVRELLDPEGKTLREKARLEPIGRVICGPIPVMRSVETEIRQSSDKQGVSLDIPTRNLAGIDFRDNPEAEKKLTAIARFYLNTSLPAEEETADELAVVE